MLLGTYPARFASGHRISIPAQYRKELGQSCVLARWYEGCLVLVGINYWNALYKRLTGSAELIINPIRDTERFILASAYEVVPDEQGRIVIPERLVGYSGLTDDIYFIGLGEKVEIWSKNAWEIKEKEVVANAAGYIEEIAKKNAEK
jgi:MraZ protein